VLSREVLCSVERYGGSVWRCGGSILRCCGSVGRVGGSAQRCYGSMGSASMGRRGGSVRWFMTLQEGVVAQ
jgi:hypothetical protein